MRVVVAVVVMVLEGVAIAEEKPIAPVLPATVPVADTKLSDSIVIAQLKAKLQELQMQVLQAEARATQCQWQGVATEAQEKIKEAAKAAGIKDLSKYDFNVDSRAFTLKPETAQMRGPDVP